MEREALDHRAARRRLDRERRRQFRRRRLFALVGIAAVPVAVVAGVGVLTGGGSGSSPSPAGTKGSNGPTAAKGAAALPAPSGPQVSGDSAKKLRIPILMYHSISIPTPGASLPELFVPTGDFTAQVQALKQDGYRAVTLDQVWDAWHGSASLPEKPVVLSFDDGYENQYLHAVPVLQKARWPGVLNLKLLSLQQGELTDAMIKKMIGAGWEIDDHTINHLDVTTLDAAGLKHEVGDSRTTLQKRFGIPVNFFCYPAGKFDDAAIAALKAAGYKGATTEINGDATIGRDPYTLPRVRIDGSDGVSGMRTKLAAAS